MNTRGISSALFGAVLMLGSSPGMALDPTFQIAAKNIQRVPTSFKFQAAISQAKMPVGEAVFQTLIVNLKKGDQPMCSETFNNVQVRDSVLNLDIGKQMSCDMDAVMAEHSGLTFQVCIGGSENCLKPVELGTVPYAVKSNFAVQAQEAHTSDVAVQSHYTHRVTADRDLFESQDETWGAGYFDFYTEDSGTLAANLETLDAITLSDTHRTEDLSVVGYTPVGTDGYISWVPTTGDTLGRVLNICARNLDTDMPAMLDRLVFHSNLITLRGDQEVFGNSVTTGDVDVGGALEVFSNADFYDDVNVEENLHVKMESDLDLAVRANYTLTVTDHTQLNSTLTTEGATQLNSTLTVEEATQLNNTLTVAADQATTLGGTLTVADNKASTLGGTLLVKDTSTLTGNVAALANATVSGTSTLTGNVSALSNMSVTGTSTLTGNVSALADATVSGTSTLSGAVTAETTLTVNGTSTLVDPVTAQSTLTVEGVTNLNDDVNIAAGKTLTNAGHTQLDHTLTVASGKATTLGGSLTVAEGQSSTFNGDVSVGADDTLTVNGTTSLQGSLTALGQVTVGQEGQDATAMSIYHNVNFLGDVTIPSDSISYNFGDQQIVYSQNIVNGEVKEADIEDNAVTAAKIADNAVSSSEIAADAVGSSEIATDAVGWREIEADAVGNEEMADNAIGNTEMQDNAIGSAEVYNNSLTADDLAPDSVGSSEIKASAVNTAELKDSAVTDAKIVTMTATKLTGTIDNARIDALTADDLAANSVGSSEIATNAVGDTEIAADAVRASEIATDAVGAAEIAAGAVGASEIATNAVGASEIAAGAVGASELATDAVTRDDVAADAIGYDEIDLERHCIGNSSSSGGYFYGNKNTNSNPCSSTALDSKNWLIYGDANGGRLTLYQEASNGNDGVSVYLYNQSSNGGRVEVRTATTTTSTNYQGILYGRDNGAGLWIGNKSQQLKLMASVDSNDNGYLEMWDDSGSRNVFLGGDSADHGLLVLENKDSDAWSIEMGVNDTSEHGYIYVADDTDMDKVKLFIQHDPGSGSDRTGNMRLYDYDSDLMVYAGGVEHSSVWKGGRVDIRDTNGNSQAGIQMKSNGTQGETFGDTKSFIVDHPLRPDKVIAYTSLEGSSVDMYHRGTYQLIDGYAEILLPEHFTLLAHPEGMSATLTPRSVTSRGLAIVALKPDRLVVQELNEGKGNYMFDYNIIAVRSGHENDPIIRDWVQYRRPESRDFMSEVPDNNNDFSATEASGGKMESGEKL